MSKRGQIYILAALLLAAVIYSLSTVVNVVEQETIKGDFKTLAMNYGTESSKLANSVLQSGGNLTESFVNFTFLFTSYSKSKTPGFNIFYALVYGESIFIGNFMNTEAKVYVPCPTKEDDCSGASLTIPGCLSNISAQMSFEELNIQSEFLRGDFEKLRESCVKSVGIGDNKEYCLDIGGVMYNLTIERNIPRIFSLNRLRSGAQILNSIQGVIGEERICEGRGEDSCKSCSAVCCWDDKKKVCLEGNCGIGCDEDKECDLGEGCDCEDCECCYDEPTKDVTRPGTCSIINLPWYCKEKGGWKKKGCKESGDQKKACPCPTSSTCQNDGSCKAIPLKKLKCAREYVKTYWCTSKECDRYHCSSYETVCAPDTCVKIEEESGCGNDNKCQLWCKETIDSTCAESPSCPSGYTQQGNPVDC